MTEEQKEMLGGAGQEQQNYSASIETAKAENVTPKVIYSVNGCQQKSQQKGLNIVRMSDGTVRKMMVK